MTTRRVLAFVVGSAVVAGMLAAVPIGAAPRGSAAPPYEGITSVPLEHLGTTAALGELSGTVSASGRTRRETPNAALARLRPRIGAGGQVETVGPPIPDPPSAPDNAAVSRQRPGLVRSWEGANSFDQGWSNNGNAFFLEPPDQGLCVGPKFVVETINSIVQVYTPEGRALLPGNSGIPGTEPVGISHNEWFGFPPAIDIETGAFGPFTTDPSCYYDRRLERWFHVVLTIQQDPVTGDFTGENSIDIAVSRSRDPLGRWDLYRLPVQNDGTDGTPDHGCDQGPCIGDYPHIGADKHGFFVTTNEYSFFGDGYTGAQLYALPKAGSPAGARPTRCCSRTSSVPSLDQRGFTVRPAWSRPASWETGRGGTEYFVSSTAGDGSETGNLTGNSDDIVVWALTNTKSLTSTARPPSTSGGQDHGRYQFPPLSLQRDGATPLLHCMNLGVDCLFEDDLGHQEGPYPLDSSDTRVTSSFFADGVLWSSLYHRAQGSWGCELRQHRRLFRAGRSTGGRRLLRLPAVVVRRHPEGAAAPRWIRRGARRPSRLPLARRERAQRGLPGRLTRRTSILPERGVHPARARPGLPTRRTSPPRAARRMTGSPARCSAGSAHGGRTTATWFPATAATCGSGSSTSPSGAASSGGSRTRTAATDGRSSRTGRRG